MVETGGGYDSIPRKQNIILPYRMTALYPPARGGARGVRKLLPATPPQIDHMRSAQFEPHLSTSLGASRRKAWRCESGGEALALAASACSRHAAELSAHRKLRPLKPGSPGHELPPKSEPVGCAASRAAAEKVSGLLVVLASSSGAPEKRERRDGVGWHELEFGRFPTLWKLANESGSQLIRWCRWCIIHWPQ